MEGIAGYASSDEDPDTAAPAMVMPSVNLAPQVDVSAVTEFRGYVDPHKKTVDTNPTYEALSQPGAFLVSRCAMSATRRRSLRACRELPQPTDW